jgi:hypothetical protein
MSTHAPFRSPHEREADLVPADLGQLPPSATLHWALMGLSLGILTASFLLVREGPEEVAIAGVNIVLPPTCGSKAMWGLDCPGCGLTRSFVSLAHGDFWASWRVNPAGDSARACPGGGVVRHGSR